MTNALSSYFTLATYRNTYMHKIIFENGVKIDDINKPLKKGDKKHGTIVEFIPNQQYLGKNCDLPFDVLMDWTDDMSYQISEGITITLDELDGLDTISHNKYKAKPFSKYIEKLLVGEGKQIGDILSLSGDGSLVEEIRESIIGKDENIKSKKKKVKKEVHLDVVFAYQDDLNTVYDSFCNFTRTEDGGVHVDSVEEVICRFLQNKTKENMTDNEKAKWDITWADVKEGLKLAINLSTDAQVQFMGNAKNKIQNDDLKPIIKEIVQTKLNTLYEENQSKFQTIFKFIKMNARARIEANKTRQASKKERMGKFDDRDMSNYVACSNTGKAYKELYLVEGEKSAKGAVVDGRFSTAFQAVYAFRGCTKNPYKVSFSEVMQNNEWAGLVKVMRCGIGSSFNLKNLYFDKICILTDADIDGHFITLGICGFFVLYFPEIIKAGKLYKVFSPLYHIDDKNHEFIANKYELMEVFMDKIVKKYKVLQPVFSKDTMIDFLYDTMNYRDTLSDLQRYFKVNKYLIELIAGLLVTWNYVRSEEDYDALDKLFSDQKFITKLMSNVQKKYPEITLKKRYIRGVVDGHYCSLEINDRFIRKISSFIDIYQRYGYNLEVKEKKADESHIMTIGEFLDDAQKLMPKIIARYKGLGEATAEQLEETTMNPDNQMLVRLTMHDCEKALATFKKLMGNKTKDAKLRKEMMEMYRLDPEDLDN